MKQPIEVKAQAINMPHQIYIVEQMNVYRGYHGSRGERSQDFRWKVHNTYRRSFVFSYEALQRMQPVVSAMDRRQ